MTMCGHRTSTRARFVADDKRASDTERDSVISDLRAHAGEGRLSVEELDQRIAAALAATTRADLARLVEDLPRRPRDRTAERREHVRSYVAVMLLLVAIWALTGAGYFWPIWPILGWGIFVLPDVRRVVS
jgi:hypothetical protein